GLKVRVRPSVNVNTKTPAEAVGLKVLQGQEIYMGPAEFLGSKQVDKLTSQQGQELVRQLELVRELSGAKHLAGTENVKGTAVVGRVVGGPEVVEAWVQTRDLTVCCDHAPLPPDKPLVLIKCADRSAAKVGDVVTFTLRYSNHGG